MSKTAAGKREHERRKTIASAEMSALCALCARHGLPSPYGGSGWVGTPDVKMAKQMERVALRLLEKAEAL